MLRVACYCRVGSVSGVFCGLCKLGSRSLLSLFLGKVATDEAASDCSYDCVAARIVTRDASDNRPFEAAGSICSACAGHRQTGNQH